MLDKTLLSKLSSNDPEICIASFSHQELNDVDVKLICEGLTNNTHVNTLLLNGNNITNKALADVTALLQRNEMIQRLELARNPQLSDQAIKKFIQAFSERFNYKNSVHRLTLNPHRNLKHLEAIENISPHDFSINHLKLHQPLVVRGAILNTKAVKQWSPSYLVEKMGDKEVPLTVHENERLSSYYSDKRVTFYVKVQQAIELMEKPTHRNALTSRVYLQQVSLDDYPEIKDDVGLPDFASQLPYALKIQYLWVGQADAYSPLHYDFVDNLFMQIYGEKVVLLYPPSDSKYLFQGHYQRTAMPQPRYISEIPNIDKLDSFSNVSKLAKPLQVKLYPGDVMYIPPAWWHEVRGLSTPSISVNQWFSSEED